MKKMPWLTQVSHWMQQAFTTLRGLSIMSIVLLLVAGLVVIRVASGLLRIIVPVACCAVAGFLLLHVLHVI